MKTEAEVIAALLQAESEKRLVSCRIPRAGDLCISFERHMVEQAMHCWKDMTPRARRIGNASVRLSIKRGVRRMRAGAHKIPQKDMDALASDVALWLAHEILFADGEKHLIKNPSKETLSEGVKANGH
jgi:hypothetical protein